MIEKIIVSFDKKSGYLKCSPNVFKLVREKFSVKNPSYQSRKFVPRLYAITPAGAFQVGLWNEIENYLRSLNLQLKIEITEEFKNQFKPKTGISQISKISNFDYYDYQEDSLKEFIDSGRGISLVATGGGKCFGKGTGIMMYDGSIKNVEDITVGDVLIGPDSKSRIVTSLARGTDMLYRISNIGKKSGIEDFVVNRSHILSFKITSLDTNGKRKININGMSYGGGDIINISVGDYLELSKTQKHVLKAWKPDIINWAHENNNDQIIKNTFPSYFLGCWLGDGCSRTPSITTMDDEIIDYVIDISKKYNLDIRISEKENNKSKSYFLTNRRTFKRGEFNQIGVNLQKYDLICNKHIPKPFLYCSEFNRLQLLAGLLDTDGHLKLSKNNKPKGYELTLKNKKLMDDVVFLCRSLGFNVSPRECIKSSQYGTLGKYYRIHINGDLKRIPCKIKRKKVEQYEPHYNCCLKGIKVEEIEEGDYYGFEVEGPDRLFLLKDFTVTHNSLIQAGLCKTFLDHYPNYKILLVVPNVSLLNQLYYSFINEYNITSVTRWGDNNLPDFSKNIIIANSQILTSDEKYTLSVVKDFNVLIVDEVHTINEKKNKISKIIHNINTPFRYGLTGTLPDSLLASWNVIGKIGPILYEKNSYELRKQQTITDVEVKVILCQHVRTPVFQRGPNPTDKYNAEFDYIISYSPRNEVIKKIANKLSGNVLIVVDRLDYISELSKLFSGGEKKVFFITGDTPTDERTEIQNTMDRESGIICIAMSKCFSTGISIKNLHYAIFAYMGKGGVKTVQTIGRTVRKHESKSKAVIFDIADNLEYSLSHLKERIKIYKNQKIDYTISKLKI